MSGPSTRRAVVVRGAAAIPNQYAESLSLVASDGTDATAGVNVDYPAVVTATAIGTAAKTTTAAEPKANTLVAIKFTNGNSANAATVAFAGGSARAVQCSGAASTGAKLALAATGVALFWFDGTILHQVGVYT